MYIFMYVLVIIGLTCVTACLLQVLFWILIEGKTKNNTNINATVYQNDCPNCEGDLIEYTDDTGLSIKYRCKSCGYSVEYAMDGENGVWRMKK